MDVKNGKIAITLSPRGIDTIAFISSDKKEALNFYKAIETELQVFERAIIGRMQSAEKEITEELN